MRNDWSWAHPVQVQLPKIHAKTNVSRIFVRRNVNIAICLENGWLKVVDVHLSLESAPCPIKSAFALVRVIEFHYSFLNKWKASIIVVRDEARPTGERHGEHVESEPRPSPRAPGRATQ